MYAPRGAWVKVTANSKPRPKNVINVQHVIKIYQALPLLRFSRHYYCVGRGSAWFQAKRTPCTRYHARVERSTSERPRDASEPGSRSTRMPALNARPTSQRSPNMLGQRTAPSTGVVLRSCSALATPWS